ncbi:MAG: hypothetical protein ACK2T7_11175 [Anaerolineales bacterium]
MSHPKRLILIGFILVLFGAAMPWFLVLKLVESTFWINFLTFGAQVVGLFLGVIGAAMLGVSRKKKE